MMSDTAAMETGSTWPPTNLSQWTMEDLQSLVDACQVEEMGSWFGSGKSRSSFWLATVQIVALLRLGEYGHARHVYRRWKDQSPGVIPSWTDEERAIFQSWWKIGQAMMTDQMDVVWTGLWEMMQPQQPEPLRTYAQEVAEAYYHQRLLPVLTKRGSSSSNAKADASGVPDPLLLGRQVPALGLYLQAYQGWKLEQNLWKPPTAAMAAFRQTQKQDSQPPLSFLSSNSGSSTNKELLHLIAFLENPQLQA